ISTDASAQASPAVSFNGTNWLVAWEDFRSGTSADVFAARVSTAGVLLDSAATGISVSAGATDETRPKIASNGSASLVVWEDQRNLGTTQTDIYGARVSTAGALPDAPRSALRPGAGEPTRPTPPHRGAAH